MYLLVIKNPFVITLLVVIAFFGELSVAGLSESFASIYNQSNLSTNTNESQTDLTSSNATAPPTEYENSTIAPTATRIGTEGNNYIRTSED
jgi:hypothetical protein